MNFKKKVVIIFAVCVGISLLLGGRVAVLHQGAKNDIIRLQILTVNDFHGALLENGKNPGAAKLAEYLKETKAKAPEATLILSAGDMFEGTVDSNLLYGKTVVDIMNEVPFDAMTLGNHEFDWGIDRLKERIGQANFPYVCANITEKSTGKRVDYVKPYVVLERCGVKIAIIGIATPETAYKTSPKVVSGYTFEDPTTVVNALVPELKSRGADVILVLTHLPSWMDENGNITGEAATLATEAHGVDAIISGHSHRTVWGKVNGVPVVQAYYNGQAVGNIELSFNKTSHQVVESTVSVTTLPYSGLVPDPAVQGLIEQEQKDIIPIKNVVVGQTATMLSHDREKLDETPLGQWVTDTMRQRVGADIAFHNSGGLRTSLSQGAITMGNLYEVMPFDDTLVTVELTGVQIRKVLDYGVMNHKIGMLQYSGLKIRYAFTDPQSGQITGITMIDGTPIDPNKYYKIVTNDFMAEGGDGFIMFKEGRNFYDTEIPERDVLADALRNQKIINFSGDDRWLAQ